MYLASAGGGGGAASAVRSVSDIPSTWRRVLATHRRRTSISCGAWRSGRAL